MKHTAGEGESQLEKDLRNILRELVHRLAEIRERKDQPEFNKGLDAICDEDEAIEKILKRTAAPELLGACKIGAKLAEALLRITGYVSDFDLNVKEAKTTIEQAISKAEGG